jgi:hypothetical protein
MDSCPVLCFIPFSCSFRSTETSKIWFVVSQNPVISFDVFASEFFVQLFAACTAPAPPTPPPPGLLVASSNIYRHDSQSLSHSVTHIRSANGRVCLPFGSRLSNCERSPSELASNSISVVLSTVCLQTNRQTNFVALSPKQTI